MRSSMLCQGVGSNSSSCGSTVRQVYHCPALWTCLIGMQPRKHEYKWIFTRDRLQSQHSETLRMSQIRGWMAAAGLETWMDVVGNVHGRLEALNPKAPAMLMGSHYDTVIDAGRFDGPLGILVAIAAVKALHVEVSW